MSHDSSNNNESNIAFISKSLKPRLIESIPLLRKGPGSPKEALPKVWVEAYGCSASMADSEMISGLLRGAGYELAGSQKEGALSLLVTCSVKDATEHRMASRIRSLARSGKPLVVAGCLPKADRALVEKLSPSASLMGPNSIDRAAEVVSSAISGGRLVALQDSASDKVNVPRVRLNPAVSIVEIASGCLSECTFCQTKLAKGWLKSYRVGDIVRQIREDLDAGCKEVWLTSTDNGCYGKDAGSNLVELLRECCAIEGDFKVRVGMMNPMYVPEMLDSMVDLFCDNNRLFKFLHIPVESGSGAVLRKMKRGHTAGAFLDIVRAFRKKIPEMTIATDMIVGFPSETEGDFQQTLDLVSSAEPDTVNLSRYSARRGTESALWKKQRVSSQVAKRRSERLHALAGEVAKKRNSLWLGWKGEIMVDEIIGKGKNRNGDDNNNGGSSGGDRSGSRSSAVQGRNYAYKPVVVSDPPEKISLGEKLSVQVYDFSKFSLKARII